ncbi:hypothetical protein N0V83_010588 [Neocucurbitaria cava]|uniref:Uncharacterized protein n=1 Tax=Neocucurbitaria cava TaxID=798079 RepID=A0A9W8XXX1_9PLEO|nr:hypothetical protein N0V83_010588 [Neocucurbitaria cava]
MSKRDEKFNILLGTNEITVKVSNLETAHAVAKEILETPGIAEKIKKIYIVTNDDDEEEDKDGQGAEPGVKADNTTTDEKANQTASTQASSKENPKAFLTTEQRLIARTQACEQGARLADRLCEPLCQIFNSSVNLKRFSWSASYCAGTSFTRPQTFWDALYAHSQTLEGLHLDYFEHEVRQLTDPKTIFPNLKTLKLNTVSAHGDDGTAIDALLNSCPNLSTLDFTWPGCDLDDCQIQNITWSYTYPSLTNLSLSGWNFAPKPLADFLMRHPSITTFADGIDFQLNDPGSEPIQFDANALPALEALYKSNGPLSSVLPYFDPAARRQIQHLALYVGMGGGSVLSELATLPAATSTIKTLEMHGNITDWRLPEDEDSSDSDSDVATDEAKEPYVPPPSMPSLLTSTLPHFTHLQELAIGMESDHIMHRRKDGVFGCPDPTTPEDLRYVLGHLPSTTTIRALRVRDERAKTLPKEMLDEFAGVPESLEYFAWEGEERVLYRVLRGDGGVKCVVCDDNEEDILLGRKMGGGWVVTEDSSGRRWSERRVLDY